MNKQNKFNLLLEECCKRISKDEPFYEYKIELVKRSITELWNMQEFDFLGTKFSQEQIRSIIFNKMFVRHLHEAVEFDVTLNDDKGGKDLPWQVFFNAMVDIEVMHRTKEVGIPYMFEDFPKEDK